MILERLVNPVEEEFLSSWIPEPISSGNTAKCCDSRAFCFVKYKFHAIPFVTTRACQGVRDNANRYFNLLCILRR
jgi:hypothetical protein